QLVGGETFLVSMRNTWAAYLVNIRTGAIEWTIGGKHSNFRFAPGAEFQWQHDARVASGANGALTMTVFDDHCCQLTGGGTYVPATGPSRGLVLSLDAHSHTARMLSQYGERAGIESEYMGDTQPLANGDVFVGWGSEPYFSEYSASGRLLFEGELPGPNLTYRATVAPWVGLPLTPPVGAARVSGGHTTVYASWNGATGVASWRVLAAGPAASGSGAGHARVLAHAPRAGFETAIPVPAGAGSFTVQALAGDGRVLGTSRQFASTA
ncbi:MAG TPA: arylsulfotransferase family protein, partial [Solirubrobacteraceae bacterium]|nr:arylsulfotransferase family protein [Solirubrobacteraceae bacterium]